jgi:PAT family beta-lactamase induction signal transducer AmpG
VPYRLGQAALGAAAPIFETVFTVVFVASALFLLAGAAVLRNASRAVLRAGGCLAVLLLLMYARRWAGQLPPAFTDAAGLVILAVPVIAGLLLLALAAQAWRELATAPAASGGGVLPQTSTSIK